MTQRRVILLQGPYSRFFACLAEALEARGALVERVLFCPGDELFNWPRRARRFRGRRSDWPGFVRDLMRGTSATDIVGLGDGRWLHSEAFAVARSLDVRVHVVEQGYLRPGWLTVERAGFGGNSLLKSTPEAVMALADREAALPDPPFRSDFLRSSVMDVGFNLANLTLGPLLYPHYRTHALEGPLREWAGWIGKAARFPVRHIESRRVITQLAKGGHRCFLLPLQLETDFQIRLHGPAGGMRAALIEVLRSFERAAPRDSRLVVKSHPLEPFPERWRRLVAATTDLSTSRVLFLDGGDIGDLLQCTAGVVTVNSTAGLTALRAGIPVKVLGAAIYDIEGITHPGPLDRFWSAPAAPDRSSVERLVTGLQQSVQVPGQFDGRGARPGAAGAAEKILSDPYPIELSASGVEKTETA